MGVYNVLARRVMAPALDLVRGCRSMSSLAELEATQWWTPDRVAALQQERLEQTVRHGFTHVPYYRQVMQERGLAPGNIRSVAELAGLPVLTKDIVRQHGDDLVADNTPHRDLLRSRTSGSTGTPLVFFTSRQDWYGYGRARGLLAMEWAGVALGDRVFAFSAGFGAPTSFEARLRPLSSRLRRETRIPLASLSNERMDELVQLLHRTRPRALAAYPTTLALLAAHIRDSGRPAPALHAILTGGEQIFEHQRAIVREVFGLEPFSRYGSHENYLMATECEAHTGLHVFAQDLVLEVVDDEGSPVAPGREGRVLVTNLRGRAMPFIRYDTGDIGSYAVAPCACGRGMPLLDLVSGRRCDAIYLRSGERVAGTGIGMSRLAPLGVTQLQLVQEDVDHLTARVVMPGVSSPDEQATARDSIEGVLRRALGPDIRIQVELVERIEPSPAGKYVPVISRVDPDSWLKRVAP